jgi:multicomponent Na+:H+ antiporter subunit E
MYPAITLLLTFVWSGLLGGISLENLVSGFVVSYGILYVVTRGMRGHDRFFGRLPKLVGFVVYYLWELVKSNAIIAYDVLTPTHHMKPGVIGIPIEAKTDLEITVLANLITMTPGTLSLDVSPDRQTLYVHAMYIHDAEALRRDIKDNLERRVLDLLR